MQAMDLPGYSHCGQASERHTTAYPFVEWQRTVYFKAQHRRQAAKQLNRVSSARDLAEVLPPSPEEQVARKRKLASEICRRETFLGNYSRFEFFKRLFA